MDHGCGREQIGIGALVEGSPTAPVGSSQSANWNRPVHNRSSPACSSSSRPRRACSAYCWRIRRVTEALVEGDGHDDGRVPTPRLGASTRRSRGSPTARRRGRAARRRVAQPGLEEAPRSRRGTWRSARTRDVAGPAESFVALWAVGRDSRKFPRMPQTTFSCSRLTRGPNTRTSRCASCRCGRPAR